MIIGCVRVLGKGRLEGGRAGCLVLCIEMGGRKVFSELVRIQGKPAFASLAKTLCTWMLLACFIVGQNTESGIRNCMANIQSDARSPYCGLRIASAICLSIII